MFWVRSFPPSPDLAALAERAAEALCGAEPLRVARLCREAEEAAWQVLGGGTWGGHGGVRSSPRPSTAPCPRQDEAKDVAKLWCGDEVARPDAADAWWGGGDGKGDGSGDAGTWQLGDAWQSDAAPQWDIDAWLGDSMTDEDVAVWLGDTMTEEDIANAWCGGDGDAKHDVNARHGYTIKEEDEVEIWCGGAATQRDVNLSNGATQRDANAGHGDAVTKEDATNAWCGGDGDTQRDITTRHGDTPEAVPRPKGGAMGAPQCLVQNGPDGVLSLDTKVLEVLRGIGQPVVVVAIAGRYRTGKSFLMNRLAQQRSGELTGLVRRLMGITRRSLMTLTPSSPLPAPQASPWATRCRRTPRASGCGACRTRAAPTPPWCCWTPRGWGTPTRWVWGQGGCRTPGSGPDDPPPGVG